MAVADARPHRPWRMWGPALALVLALSMVWLLFMGQLWRRNEQQARDEEQAEAASQQQRDAGLAAARARQIEQALMRMQVVLEELIERDALQPQARYFEPPADLTEREPALLNLGLVNAQGLLTHSLRPLAGPVSLRQLPFFEHHRTHADPVMRIGQPAVGVVTGLLGVALTRRINAPDGSFGGVAVAVVDPAFFTQLLDAPETESGRLLLLVGTDGVVRSGKNTDLHHPGDRLDVSGLMATPPGGVALKQVPIGPDGGLRWSGVSRLADWPLAVVASSRPVPVSAGLAQHQTVRQRWLAAQGAGLALLLALPGMLIRRQRQEVQALKATDRRLRRALEQGAGDGVWDYWFAQDRLQLSDRWCAMLGYGLDELGSQPSDIMTLLHPEDLPGVRKQLARIAQPGVDEFTHEHRLRCKSGEWKWVLCRGRVLARGTDGRPTRLTGTDTDMHERKLQQIEARQLSTHLALHDPLTGLPHRRALLENLPALMAAESAQGRSVALVLLDLDDFKNINDTLGHFTGDRMLQALAQRLLSMPRPAGAVFSVYRMGGDEFCLVMSSLPAVWPDAAEAATAGALKALRLAFRIDGHLLRLSASAGLALFPQHGARVEELLRAADLALCAAKRDSLGTYRTFTPPMLEDVLRRNSLAHELARAVPAGQLRLHYQPIVSLADGYCHRVEALVRWQHPQRGLLLPADFIEVAETRGVVVALGSWVFHAAVAQVCRWRTAGLGSLQISLNTSAAQFRDGGAHLDGWLQTLQTAGVPGSALRVELTESLLMIEARHNVREQLLRLQSAGIGLSVDDFGTGYSALSVLELFNADCVKIDRVLVKGVLENARSRSLCRAVIDLAHALGATVVAEGVESADQAELLRDMGCDYAQGHHFARPMPEADLVQWLTGRAQHLSLNAPLSLPG